MTYRCTKCEWKGPWRATEGTSYPDSIKPKDYLCPKCGSPVEDLDLLERAAIREIDGGDDLVCNICGNHVSAPFDISDECCCGGKFYEYCELVDEATAREKAIEEIKRREA